MKITLPYDFVPRDYQTNAWNALMQEQFRRGMLVWPRRNGKDLFCWNVTIAKASQRVGTYFYMAPYYNQARNIIWQGADGKGRRFLDYIPKGFIEGKPAKLDMRVTLKNGSQIKLVGSDNIDAIVGTNPIGIVYTEFSLHKRGAWDYLRPVLAENDGWAIFNFTPRGMGNEAYEIYSVAMQMQAKALAAGSPANSWFLEHLSRDDTNIPSLEAIEADRESGMPEALIQQEYYTSFLSGNVGSYYDTQMQMVLSNDQQTDVPYDPRLPVYTFWDLGKRDATAVWFIQFTELTIRIIDYYEQAECSLIDNIKAVKERPYTYEEHWAPHDIKVEEMTNKRSRWDTAADHGIEFMVVPKYPLMEGIETTREVIPRCWFDREKTQPGWNALIHYHKKYDAKGEVYSEIPAKSWANHGADAFRMMAVMIDEIMDFKSAWFTKPVVRRAIDSSRYSDLSGVRHRTDRDFYGSTPSRRRNFIKPKRVPA